MLHSRRTALTLAIASASLALTAQAQESARLDNIVVTAAGFEQALQDAPASISVVTREELERKRYSNIAEAIAEVPGVDVRSGVGKTGGLNVSIRGMPSHYTLILIDGRRQNASGDVTPNGFGETSTSFMPPLSAIERIEVIRGPMSTLYGSDAMGGVINIITRPVSATWTGSVTLDTTFQQDRDAGNAQGINLYTSGPLVDDVLGLQLRGRLFDRDASERMIADSAARDPRPTEARLYLLGGRLTLRADEANSVWLDAERARQTYANDDCRLGTLDGTNRATCAPSQASSGATRTSCASTATSLPSAIPGASTSARWRAVSRTIRPRRLAARCRPAVRRNTATSPRAANRACSRTAISSSIPSSPCRPIATW